ncbi:MAG: hypothetical protein SA339_13120 [Methanomassiliicoccus sp.]|nr:hypothetical protein [Methanomassiliicoccus sp.]
MTRTIEFTRQLWPQPPKDGQPYFCLMNTLCFIDEDCHELWRQRIPEGLIKWDFDKKGVRVDSRGNLRHMNGPLNMRVEWDDTWGWLLKFYLTHGEAKHVWGQYLRFRTRDQFAIELAYCDWIGKAFDSWEALA